MTGLTGVEIYEITPFLIETFVLLTSSFTIRLAIDALCLSNKKQRLLLSGGCLAVEIYEFIHYAHIGAGIQTSGFTSIFLTTLGTSVFYSCNDCSTGNSACPNWFPSSPVHYAGESDDKASIYTPV